MKLKKDNHKREITRRLVSTYRFEIIDGPIDTYAQGNEYDYSKKYYPFIAGYVEVEYVNGIFIRARTSGIAQDGFRNQVLSNYYSKNERDEFFANYPNVLRALKQKGREENQFFDCTEYIGELHEELKL